MNSETKKCQNCHNQFTIEPDDFDFYTKIGVPAPTFCWECRLQRRLTWRNERGLSKRKCSAPGHTEDIISIYSDPKFPVYDHEYWWSDKWDAASYGQDYDFSRPFFTQFRELLEKTPHLALFDSKSVNSKYCNYVVEQKNCYLVSASWTNEDSSYANRLSHCKDTMDSHICFRTEIGYENVYCRDSYHIFFSRNSESCNNSYFLYDCRGCSNCVCSAGLRNKQYYIFNQPYTKEEYQKKVKELNLGSRKTIHELKQKMEELRLASIHRYAQIFKSVNVTGDNIEQSKNCKECFDVMGNAEDSKYCVWSSDGMKTCYDSGPGSGGKSELTYETISVGVVNSRCGLCATIWYSNDVWYSYNCHSCQYCFGCVNLRNKKYCIFNKQYSKEEYDELLPRIQKHMAEMPYKDAKGRTYGYGEFFPIELSPFGYNETIAQEFIPLKKEEAEKENFSWRVPGKRDYTPTLRAVELLDSIEEVKDDVTKEIIECAHAGKCSEDCATAFRIVPAELDFYRRFNLPLPQLCFNCRHAGRLAQKNPLKLWKRQCQCAGEASENGVYKNSASHHHGHSHCEEKFETTFGPERPEIVYCEQCYQSEVI